MFKKNYKKIISLILVIVMLVSYRSISLAYINISYGSVSASVDVEERISNHTLFVNSKNAWNYTATPVWITAVPGSGHSWVIDGQYGDEWYGLYTAESLQYIFWGRATKFSIKLNRTLLVSEGDNFWQSVLVHEFGHAFCLDDNPNSSVPNSSIMNYNRSRNTLITPQADDINGVNNAY